MGGRGRRERVLEEGRIVNANNLVRLCLGG